VAISVPDPGLVRLLWIGRLGDLLVSTPLLRALRLRFPGARLELVTGERGEAAAALLPDVGSVRVLRRAHRPLHNLALAARLASEPAGLLVDCNPAFSRAAWTLAALARARVKLAFRKGRGDSVFTDLVDAPAFDEHVLSRYARLAGALGADYEPRLAVRIPPRAEDDAEALLKASGLGGPGLLVGVFPGNFKKFDNRWPEENFAELARRASGIEGVRLAFLAGPGERESVLALAGRSGTRAPVLGPLGLGVTAAVLRRLSLLVANATGTAHLAAAVGTPTFALLSRYTRTVWMYPAPCQPQSGGGHFSVVSESWDSCRDISVERAWPELRRALEWAAGRKV
jgi:heptosyltransferase-2/heptosyltransferase-3